MDMQELPNIPTYQINEQNLVHLVWVDELIHTAERPWCNDPTCPCKLDEALYREYAAKPIEQGLMTRSEATRLFLGKQLGQLHDAPVTDDEPNSADRHNVWNGYEQEMAWEAAEEQWQRATDGHDFEPDELLHTDESPYCDDPACWCHRCEQELPFTGEEIEQIMSDAADKKMRTSWTRISTIG
jgi:hypothetical protein